MYNSAVNTHFWVWSKFNSFASFVPLMANNGLLESSHQGEFVLGLLAGDRHNYKNNIWVQGKQTVYQIFLDFCLLTYLLFTSIISISIYKVNTFLIKSLFEISGICTSTTLIPIMSRAFWNRFLCRNILKCSVCHDRKIGNFVVLPSREFLIKRIGVSMV